MRSRGASLILFFDQLLPDVGNPSVFSFEILLFPRPILQNPGVCLFPPMPINANEGKHLGDIYLYNIDNKHRIAGKQKKKQM